MATTLAIVVRVPEEPADEVAVVVNVPSEVVVTLVPLVVEGSGVAWERGLFLPAMDLRLLGMAVNGAR